MLNFGGFEFSPVNNLLTVHLWTVVLYVTYLWLLTSTLIALGSSNFSSYEHLCNWITRSMATCFLLYRHSFIQKTFRKHSFISGLGLHMHSLTKCGVWKTYSVCELPSLFVCQFSAKWLLDANSDLGEMWAREPKGTGVRDLILKDVVSLIILYVPWFEFSFSLICKHVDHKTHHS